MALTPSQQAESYLTTSTKTDICDSTTTSLSAISLEKWGRVQTISVGASDIPARSWTDIGVLKTDFRPSANLTFPAMTGGETDARIRIKSDGTISVYTSATSTSNATGTVTFIGK